jgi:omega-6 fatty acid desaturase (delta-12 desaturase)
LIHGKSGEFFGSLQKENMINVTASHVEDRKAAAPAAATPAWKAIVAKYEKPSLGRAIWQMVNTLVPFAALWWLMSITVTVSWWYTVPLAILAAGFVVRAFIIFHDCGHGSFFANRTANNVVGFITGMITFTPYLQWRWEHAVHHATNGDLDRRSVGDVWTMTVKEFEAASPGKRFLYRLNRNPFILFAIVPVFLFMVHQRFPNPKASPREKRSAWWMNLALVGMMTAMSLWLGFKTYIILQVIVMGVAASAGVWLFYVQHQFEDTYWERSENWDFLTAALKGSSFYKLPKILQWFSGNIGFHHIHHLSSRIPNYYLEKCHKAEPLFQQVKPITLWSSMKSLTFRLWDEEKRKLVGYPRRTSAQR